MQSELKNKRKDLSNFVAHLANKRKFIDDAQLKLKDILKESKESISYKISDLIREFNIYKTIDENLKYLQSDIEKVNSLFFEKLGSTVCHQIKLNFSA